MKEEAFILTKQIILHFIDRLTQNPTVKLAVGFFLWLMRLLYGPVCRPAYTAVILLWLADTATGYYCARTDPGVRPESRKMYHGLVKLFLYYFLLFLGYQCSRAESTAFAQAVIESFIILTESYSILENLQRIARLKEVDVPFLDRIIRVVQGRLDKEAGETKE